MDKLFDFALKSALPDSRTALDYWNQANQILPLEDWPGEISRLASCFYDNHGKYLQLTNSSLLKGIYKSNWARNSLALAALIPVVQRFEDLGVEYRLIKGGAIILYINSIGARRMGDLDLVIERGSREVAQQVLNESGFAPRYPGDRRGKANEIWENSKGVVLDLHYVNRFHNFHCVFEGSIEKNYMGNSFKLPNLETSILIAAIHGKAKHSNGDFLQSAWDISMLLKLANEKALVDLANKYGAQNELQQFINHLKKLECFPEDRNFSTLRISVFGIFKERLFALVRSLLVTPKPKVLNISNFRFQYFLTHRRELNDWYYIFWGMFGMIRPIERVFTSRKGLLARNRKIESRDHLAVFIKSNQFHNAEVGFELRHIFANELRVLIQKPDLKRMKLDLVFDLERPSPRMLFINGISHGHIAPSLGNKYGFELEGGENRIELSFRDFSSSPLPWLGKIDIYWSNSPLN
jgi:hypothetical protein